MSTILLKLLLYPLAVVLLESLMRRTLLTGRRVSFESVNMPIVCGE